MNLLTKLHALRYEWALICSKGRLNKSGFCIHNGILQTKNKINVHSWGIAGFFNCITPRVKPLGWLEEEAREDKQF